MHIHTMQSEAGRIAREHGFTEVEVGTKLMLMVGELSEAMEEYRDGHAVNEIYSKGGKPEGAPIELADVVIRIGSFCDAHGINLEDAVALKLHYNEARPWKHGGKKF